MIVQVEKGISAMEKAERSALSYAELKDQYLQGRFPRRLI